MKKLLLLAVIAILSFFGLASAHPGDTSEDANGCHYCWTNCASWGEVYGEMHCHEESYGICGFDDNLHKGWILKASYMQNKGSIMNKTIGYNMIEDSLKFQLKAVEGMLFSQESAKNKILANKDAFLLYANSSTITQFDNLIRNFDKIIYECNTAKKLIEGYMTEIDGYQDDTNLDNEGMTNNSKGMTNSELTEAILWMYNNGLTSYSTIDKFMGEDYLTREQASKFFSEFGEKILNMQAGFDVLGLCNFTDTSKANSTLKDYINRSCRLGLIKGNNKKFLPFNKLTKAQAIAIIIRAKDGTQNEKGNKWYTEYYNDAENYGLLKDLGFNASNLDSLNIKRKEMALLLYRMSNYLITNPLTPDELCRNQYGDHMYSDGIMLSGGNYNCYCETGYTWSGFRCYK